MPELGIVGHTYMLIILRPRIVGKFEQTYLKVLLHLNEIENVF